jgi:hypothetical protein
VPLTAAQGVLWLNFRDVEPICVSDGDASGSYWSRALDATPEG